MFVRRYRRWAIVAFGVVLLAFFGMLRLLSSTPVQWTIVDYGPTLPLSQAIVLGSETETALIWQTEDSLRTLVYTSLDAPQKNVRLQLYADGPPSAWQVVQTRTGTLQAVWQERDGRLRSALLTTDGFTLRGPVALADQAEHDFALFALNDGGAWTFWRTTSEQIASVQIDAEGRPGPTQKYTPRHVQKLAAAGDGGHVYLVWAEPSAPDVLTLHYATLSALHAAEAEALSNSAALGTWKLAPTESVRTFALGMDATYGYLLLGVMDASAPHHERVTVLSFPLGVPERVHRIPLTLAAHPTPTRALQLGTFSVPQAETLSSADAEAAPLRWPRPAVGAWDFFALALAVRRGERWQPAIVYFQNGEPRGYEVLNAPPADAAPPTLALRPDGTAVLSWAGLVRGEARRYSARAVP